MENIPGESTTDQHHRGVWLAYRDVNGFDFWQNEFSYQNKNAGKVITRRIYDLKSGQDRGSFRGTFAWLSPTGDAILEESRTMTFWGDSKMRIVDADITLKALVDTTFGDAKDGAFSVRLARASGGEEFGRDRQFGRWPQNGPDLGPARQLGRLQRRTEW